MRQANEDYKVPNTSFVIEKGMGISIPVHSIHHDPEIDLNSYVLITMLFTLFNMYCFFNIKLLCIATLLVLLFNSIDSVSIEVF